MPGTIAPTSQLARPPHLDNGDQRAILVEGGERPAQVIGLRHWRAPSLLSNDDGATSSPPAPYHLDPGISRLENLPDRRALLRLGRALIDQYCASFRTVPRRIVLDVDDTPAFAGAGSLIACTGGSNC